MRATSTGSEPAIRPQPIVIRTDAADLARPLMERLQAGGFAPISVLTLTPSEAMTAMIAVTPGPLAANEAIVARLILDTAEYCAAAGIDRGRYPVQRLGASVASPVIDLPLNACLTGSRPSYAGAHPDRYETRIESDDTDASHALAQALEALRFRTVRRTLADVSQGFRIRYPKEPDAARLVETIGREVERMIQGTCGAHAADYPLIMIEADVKAIEVSLPIAAARDGSLAEKLASPGNYALTIYTDRADVGAHARAVLAPMSWRSISMRKGRDGEKGSRIVYGGAPQRLLKRMDATIRDGFAGLELRQDREWALHDRDVWIVLSETVKLPEPAELDAARAMTAAVRQVARRTVKRGFIDPRGSHVRIGPVKLERCARHPLAPDPSAFNHYVLDQATAETTFHVALAIHDREPCLLEGTTATSKTSTMIFVASLTNDGVLRLNLNGHSDASELVGRHLPTQQGWRWCDGAIPRAMREGLLCIIDELNLGEAYVVERLNSALEQVPTLFISENDGEVIGGAGGTAVHPRFRILATINPADSYVGRSQLSPAFKDRFTAYRYVARASEGAIHDLLRLLFRGVQPEVVIDGVRYASRRLRAGAPYGALAARLPALDRLSEALARFHVGAEAACAAPGLEGTGSVRTITRRSLLGCVRSLAGLRAPPDDDWARALWRMLDRYYFARFTDAATRGSVISLAIAVGIDPEGWSFA